MEILKRVIIKSLIILLPIALLSGFYEWKRLPLGIIAGGLLGILNLRSIVRNVEGFIGTGALTAKVLIMSMTRMLFFFAMVAVLLWFRLINVFGMLFGFTVVLILILIEGLRVSKLQ
jgi:hypothetical protein